MGVGDDGVGENAQDLGSLLGKILRIDVAAGSTYAIPAGNPFVDLAGARTEIWAYGLRNPWRFSFDSLTNDPWIADVGDTEWEEVNRQSGASAGGEDYGWPIKEGNDCVGRSSRVRPGLTAPVFEYDHDMNCSVTGGYVYRGSAVPAVAGVYVFGDFCTGGVFAPRQNGDAAGWRATELALLPIKLASFGVDAAGELYVVDFEGGNVYRVDGATVPPLESSETRFNVLQAFKALLNRCKHFDGDPAVLGFSGFSKVERA